MRKCAESLPGGANFYKEADEWTSAPCRQLPCFTQVNDIGFSPEGEYVICGHKTLTLLARSGTIVWQTDVGGQVTPRHLQQQGEAM